MSAWKVFNEREPARCECGKMLFQVAPNVVAKVRERPEYRVQGERHITQKCHHCGREMDVTVEVAA